MAPPLAAAGLYGRHDRQEPRSASPRLAACRGRHRLGHWNFGRTPEELKTRLEELRTLITDKLVELEEDANWGTEEERAEVVVALDELIVQAQAMSELLQEEP